MRICRGCCGHLGQRWRKNKKAARGRIKGVRPTQSREGVKGGLRPFSSAPCRVKGQRPLWGLGQRPNCWSGDQYQESCQQRRRQQSVPASNFARPQTRPPSRSTQQLCCVAPNGRDHTACLPPAHTILRKTWAPPHNSAARLPMSFPPSAACKFLDLPPVNLRNLHLHLTKNPFVSRPPHLCGVTLAQIPQI